MSDKSLVSSNEVWLAIQQRVRGIQTKSIESSETGLWHAEAKLSAEAKQLLNLYAPVVATSKKQSLVVAHLGQSLDGYISTVNGDSHYVNGTENIIHLHRMRALFDAVLVGANTVDIDDPTLTTRLVSGDNLLGLSLIHSVDYGQLIRYLPMILLLQYCCVQWVL